MADVLNAAVEMAAAHSSVVLGMQDTHLGRKAAASLAGSKVPLGRVGAEAGPSSVQRRGSGWG